MFKQPDRKAPRYRQSCARLLNQDTYQLFLDKHPEEKDCDLELFKKVVKTFNGMLWQGVIDNRDGVELPDGLGNIFIGSCKTPVKRENVDVNTTINLGVKVINRNLASDGYLAKIFYSNHHNRFRFKYRNFWKFKGVRPFTSATSKAYRVDWPKYRVIEDFEKISKIFLKQYKVNYMKKLQTINTATDNYNEFELD
jgi:hypothetical protein